MTALTDDIAMLCRAIDDGDDECLPILADALEEAGDARAAWLRMSRGRSPHVMPDGQAGWIGRFDAPDHGDGANLRASAGGGPSLYDAVKALPGWVSRADHVGLFFPTRSAAFLALANAMAKNP